MGNYSGFDATEYLRAAIAGRSGCRFGPPSNGLGCIGRQRFPKDLFLLESEAKAVEFDGFASSFEECAEDENKPHRSQ